MSNAQTGPIILDWNSMRKASQRDKRIILKLAHFSGVTKLRYRCHSKHQAKSVWKAIVAYHQEYLHKKFSTKRGVLLAFANPEQLLQDIAANVTVANVSIPNAKDQAKSAANEKVDKKLETVISTLNHWISESKLKQSEISRNFEQIATLYKQIHAMVMLNSKGLGIFCFDLHHDTASSLIWFQCSERRGAKGTNSGGTRLQ